MKASVVITLLNEEKSVIPLLNSLVEQTRKADEILIVDGGSTDKTKLIIKKFIKSYGNIKLIEEKCSRAKGRNLGVELARNEIIAMTDAGCIAKKDWLEKITTPFVNDEIEIIAGFYKMLVNNSFQKALAYYIGVVPKKFDYRFLASTRSIAFRRGLWDRVGGFPESLEDTAEDTVFNYRVIKARVPIARMKSAIVFWNIPNNLSEAVKKFYAYAKGDAKSGIFWQVDKGISSHNIKVLLIFARYLFALILVFSYKTNVLALILLGIIVYMFYAYRKVFIETNDIKAGLWSIILQFSSDISVMFGFVSGIIKK